LTHCRNHFLGCGDAETKRKALEGGAEALLTKPIDFVTLRNEIDVLVWIREAIRKEGMVAIGKIAFTSREHIMALEPRDKGMMGITLRYPYEVRKQSEYFEDIKNEKVPKDMLDLALHVVGTKRGDFEPEKFEDQYEDALKELLRKKQQGEKIERPKEPARSNVINLMDALRESVQAESARGSERRKLPHTEHRASRKTSRSHARRKKAG
jgi:DNA end-binding protein Ku